MRRSLRRMILASVTGVCLVAANSASAATEFGDTCAGAGGAPGDYTLTTLSGSSPTLPLTAPSGGVITKVKVNSAIEIPVPYPVTVKLLRSAGGNKYTVVGSQSLNAGPGITVADARIPVQVGDKLGVHGEAFNYGGETIHVSPFCVGVEGELGAYVGDAASGSTVEFFEAAPARTPLAAVIEPDADGDGYGDETQDKCPQSASTHDECPPVVIDSLATPGKGKAIVLIATDTAGEVTVSGSVKLPKAAKGGKKAGASATVQLKSLTKAATPGQISRFVLKFPGSLKQALAALPKGKKMKLKITATETNVAGKVSQDSSTLKLKG
jgi:hypothetical protein